MRVRILTASLALVFGCGVLGCKSAPKMAWWSSSKDAKVESTAVAHAAPQLPSEIAKQTEGVNPADPLQITTAPAFAANTKASNSNAAEAALASAYPSTGAPSYVPTKSVAAITIPSTNAMPYNPAAVPAAKTPPSNQALASNNSGQSESPAAEDRYGNLYSKTAETVTTSTPTSGPSYPNFSTPAPTASPSPAVSSSGNVGDRYAMATVPSPAAFTNSTPPESQEVQTASAIAAAEPYRPGGTGTYPAIGTSNAKYEVASRPATTGSSQVTVPNVAYPSTGANQYR